MSKKLVLTVVAIAILAISSAFAGTTGAAKADSKSPDSKAAGMAMGHRFANAAAVCGCGKVFVPNADTKTFSYEGKEYACCSDECHKKLSSMTPAEAAKACETQMAKLSAAPAPATPAATATPK